MGKKSGGSAPAAPDPQATAAAQTQQNKETAYWNAVLNNVNQVTPYGTLTYAQTGGGKKYNTDAYNQAMQAFNSAVSNPVANQRYQFRNANWFDTQTGRNLTGAEASQLQSAGLLGSATSSSGYSMPKLEDFYIGESPPEFTSTIKLTPEQQAILDRQTANQKALVDLGGQQLSRIGESVASPFSFGGLEAPEVAQGQFEDAIYSRLNPQFSRDEEAMRSRLINQGIGQGSEAYRREMEQFNQAKNDARMQAILGGQDYALRRRNQAINEYTTQRSAPLNEYIGLTSGVQVQNPQFQSTGYSGANPADITSAINQQYQGALNQYNQNVASRNATQQGIFSLGGSLLGAAGQAGGFGSLFSFLSDINLKENIVPMGEKNGHKIYEFSYKHIPQKRFVGVMAQDVEKYLPEAITEHNGYKSVNYALIGFPMQEVA